MLLFAVGYVVMLGAGYFMFGFLPPSDPLQIGFTILLAAFALLPAGLLIGVAFKRFQSAFNAGMLLMQPMIVLSGAGLPREAFPQWAQRVSDFIPSTYAVQVTDLGWHDAYLSRAAIWPSTILVVFGAACAFAAAVVFRNSYR
jgi:ABC-type multidrug transport system permease subunit